MSQLDINRQALIEARLRARQFEEFFEAMPDCLVEMEIGSRRVTLMNAAARQELGHTLAGIDGGLNAVDLIHPDYFDIIQQVHLRYAGESIANRTLYDRVMSQETFEWVLRRSDGSFFPGEVEASYVLDHEGVPVRARYLFRDISERKRGEEERSRLIAELQEAVDNVRTLSGLLPICSICKNIRDDSGYWTQIESYIRKRASTDFSHGLCPSCRAELER
jgi:PAS domain S-box-containing protein